MALTALYSGATGMQAQQTNIDIIANNIANVNTTAFKASHANYQDLLYQQITPAGTEDASSNRVPVETAREWLLSLLDAEIGDGGGLGAGEDAP